MLFSHLYGNGLQFVHGDIVFGNAVIEADPRFRVIVSAAFASPRCAVDLERFPVEGSFAVASDAGCADDQVFYSCIFGNRRRNEFAVCKGDADLICRVFGFDPVGIIGMLGQECGAIQRAGKDLRAISVVVDPPALPSSYDQSALLTKMFSSNEKCAKYSSIVSSRSFAMS